jgi:hypothetical protein
MTMLRKAARVEMTPVDPSWIDGPNDVCAHGGLIVVVDRQVVVDDRTERWSLGPSAVFLLRTLTADHVPEAPVCQHLFPCCAFAPFVDDEGRYHATGCPNGRDFAVRHRDRSVLVGLDAGTEIRVAPRVWRAAVLRFSDAIEAFYACSPARQPSDDDAEGYRAFRKEWHERRIAAGGAGSRRRTPW